MEDYILGKILDVLNTVENLGTGILIQSPETFNTTLYNGIINIMDNAVMPVASIILALFLVLELYKISVRTEGMSNLGIEIPMKTLFKFVLCKVVMDNLRLILLAMNEVSGTLITNMNNVFNSSVTSNITNIDNITQTIESMEFGVQLLTSVEVTIIWLLIKSASLLAKKLIRLATSSGSPARLTITFSVSKAMNSSSIPSTSLSVAIKPGATALTVT